MWADDLERLWREYIKAEEDWVRPVLLAALDRFLCELKKRPPEEWEDWAFDLAERHSDHGDSFPIRMPLFREAIFPALLKGYREGRPHCARWLAGFSLLMYQCKECQEALKESGWSKWSLLEKALEHNPDDTRARGKLIAEIAWFLEYSLHEIPAGVLCGSNFAAGEECLALRETFAEFKRLVLLHGEGEEHEDLIEECEFHYQHYPEYIRHRQEYRDYEEFLERL